jgi:hypothetical protein
MLRWLTLPLFLLLSCVAQCACQITITNVEMCDSNGVVMPWNYTMPFFGVRVSWTVTGTPTAPYNVRIQIADLPPNISGPDSGPGGFVAVYAATYPSLRPLPVRVIIDPGGVSGNTTPAAAKMTKTFTATPPTTGVAYYNPQTLFGSQTISAPVTSGPVPQVVMLLGKPTSETSQNVVSITSTGTLVSTTPLGYPGWQKVFKNAPVGTCTLDQHFQVTESNAACNLQLLNGATWAQMDLRKTSLANYLGPEQQVETGDPNIIAFTNASLPANYRTTLTPLQTAMKLFAAVVNATTYVATADGAASVVLQTHTGNCGGMTNLFNACLRIVGIPCRSVCGWWMDKTPHCWSEMYFPGFGWVPADTSVSKRAAPVCTYLTYFGYSPSGNQRCSVCRANTMNTPLIQTTGVQWGAMGVIGAGVGTMTTTVALSTTPVP